MNPNPIGQVPYAKSLQLCQLFVTPWAVAHQIPLSRGFAKQEYWTGLPFPPPGDLLDPRTEPTSLRLLHWPVRSLPLTPPGKPNKKGKFEPETYTQGECWVKVKVGIGGLHLWAEECRRLPEAREEAGNRLSPTALGRSQRRWDLALGLLDCETIHLCGLSHQVCGALWQKSWETNTGRKLVVEE